MRGWLRHGPAATILALLVVANFPTGAGAKAPEKLFRTPPSGESGSAAGQLGDPRGIGVDPKTGHFHVADANNMRISEFTSQGAFVKAWGWGVVASGPDNKPQNERQEVTVSATAGGFSLGFSNPFVDGGSFLQDTAPLAFDASAAAVQGALEALESPTPGDVVVSGPAGGPWTVEFTGRYADADVLPLRIVKSTLTGTGEAVTVKTIQGGANFEICDAAEGDVCRAGQGANSGQGGGASAGQFTFPGGVTVDSTGDVYVFDRRLGGEKTARVQKFTPSGEFLLMFGGDVVAHGPDDSTSDERQDVSIAADSGTFRLGFENRLEASGVKKTPPLPYNASSKEVEDALNALSTIGGIGGSVKVTGGPGDAIGSTPYQVFFKDNLGGDDLAPLTVDTRGISRLVGSLLECSATTTATTVSYQWLRDGTPIGGATSPTYTTVAADEGKTLQCQVFAINANAGSTQVANPVQVIAPHPGSPPPVAPANIPAPAQSASLTVGGPGGQTLTCNPQQAEWMGASSFSYKWYRNGVEIGGATNSTYSVTAGDLATAATFQCAVTGTNVGGSATKVSDNRSTSPAPSPPPPSLAVSMPQQLTKVVTGHQGGGAEVCKAADVCQRGAIGEEGGQFANTEVGNYIAAGPAGTIFVGDKGRIQEFGPDGKFKGEIKLSGELAGKTVQQLALDGAGNFYVVLAGEEKVRKLNPAGEPGEPKSFPVAGVLKGAGAIALDSAGDIYAVEDPPSFGNPISDARVVEFDPAGNKLIPDEEEIAKKEFFAQEGANIPLTGLATSHCEGGEGLGALYVSVRSGHISAYGSDPGCKEAEAQPPGIEAQYAASVGTTEAVLKAEINPHFYPSTTYYLEYGTEDCEVAVEPCASQPAPPGDLLGAEGGSAATTAGIALSGLVPGATYHYRFVAISGELVTEGEDRTFTTYRDDIVGLPDNRAYEMVSPLQKNSAEVASQGGLGNGLFEASQSGDSISYKSTTAFGEAKSAPQNNQYLSGRKSSGWSTQNITPPDQGGRIENAVRGFSPDLSRTVLVVLEPPLCCGATPGLDNLYLRDNSSGALELLTSGEEPRDCVAYGGASVGFGRVILAALGSLTPGSPGGKGFNLYEWSAAEGLRLASILPDGTPASPSMDTGFGAAVVDSGCKVGRANVQHAISADGSRIFWTFGGEYKGAKVPLLARVGGSETIELDLPQGGPGPAGGGKFWAASADGSKVLFTTNNKLTADAKTGDLYRYDFDAPEGERLSDLTAAPEAANVRGLLGASEIGDYAYFVATGVLAENEGAAVELETGLPEKAKAGQNNLYLWHEGEGIRFIGRLTPGEADNANWQPGPEFRTPRVSPDGRHLAFLTGESLSGYDNTGQGSGKAVKEAYLYGAEADELLCASCNPSGARPTGPAALTAWKLPYEQPRFLSDGGGRLFFESFDSLDPRDTNGVRDVYQLEREGVGDCTSESPTFSKATDACVALISSGESDEDSYFIDASASGDDVFISTRQQLIGADEDEHYDVYDARVGGGFPEPPPIPACAGEACRGALPEPPATSPAGSPGFIGPSDPPPLHCRKGQVKRRGRCVPGPRKPRHHRTHKHHRQQRAERRSAK